MAKARKAKGANKTLGKSASKKTSKAVGKSQTAKQKGEKAKIVKGAKAEEPVAHPVAVKPAKAVKVAKVLKPAALVEPAGHKLSQAKAALKRVTSGQVENKSKNVPAKAGRTRKIAIDIDPNEASTALAQKWLALHKKAEQIESKTYNMKAVFEEKTAIVHKVLGWGYILANRNDRLEVLFKDGIKYLISNYKA